MKKLMMLLLPILFVAGLTLTVPKAAYASTPQSDVCEGIGLADENGNCTEPSNGLSVENLIHTTINILSYIVGVAAIIMVILGGFKYITADGDASKVTSAKNTIMYALIGLVVAALAQAIVLFVFKKSTAQPEAETSSLLERINTEAVARV